MYDLSKLIALLLSFALGFAMCAGIFVGAVMGALESVTVRDLQEYGVPIPTDNLIGSDPKVDLLNMSVVDLYDELQEVRTLEGGLTIRVLEERYAIVFPEHLNKLISEQTRDIPLNELFTDEGIATILSSVYIGYIEGYECHNLSDAETADPKDKDNTRWYNPNSGAYISGIDETIAYFTLQDFVTGNINTDAVLHDIVLCDVLGYTFDEEQNSWFDKEGNKVTGIMAVFADCHIDEVGDRMNSTDLGFLLGYEEGEDGNWYEVKEGSAQPTPVSGFMSKIANSNINSIGTVFDSLEIGDIVEEEDRTGIFAIIPAETNITNIGSTVNDKIMTSPLQFFINEGLITFSNDQIVYIDGLCISQGKVSVFSTADEEAAKYYSETTYWDSSKSICTIPTWRTKPLTESFSYVIEVISGAVVEPDIDLDL